MKRWLTVLLSLSIITGGFAQVREMWRFQYPADSSNLNAKLSKAIPLYDGGMLLLGAVETPLNGYDAVVIELGSNGTPEWSHTFDGAGLDDAFVDAVPIFYYANPVWFYLLAEFTN